MRSVTWSRFFTGALYLVIESRYFGWHMWPKSDAEMICDGIGLLIIALSYQEIK